ncbi:MAG TPA: efflux RND transporter periplasmic adaptor subunit [Pseudogracilibacillus sp.]|nr:efflux RND transporter periplasmic adaptor subunit [Pseudogracilibacillus sp.]
MSKRKLIIGISVAILILFFISLAIIKSLGSMVDGELTEEETEVLVEKVKEEKLKETILVTGQIVSEGEQKIYQEAEKGTIVSFNVKEGDKVKKGDPLFVYDGSALEREFANAVNGRNMSQNNVKTIENQIAELTKQINRMKQVVNEPLADDEEPFASPADEVRQLEMEKNQLAIELEGAKGEVSMAQAEINELEKQKTTLTVTSNIDGKVISVNEVENRGEDNITEPVIHIVSNEPFKVIGQMSEYDSVKIKKGQEVIIRPKVYKDRDWKGKVESISEFPKDDGSGDSDYYGGGEMNVTMYPFVVAIEDDTKDLRQGFHVSLEVNVSEADKSLVVPHMAIMDELMMDMEDDSFSMTDELLMGMGEEFEEDDMQFVYVLVDGILERRDIETGKMSDEYVEIISGVELNELVVVNPDWDMYDGMEVETYDQVD